MWKFLVVEKFIADACAIEREGSSVLVDLLLDMNVSAPLLPDVSRAELIASLV